ncbi:NAD kinase [Moheibacter sediminis]|uniref:NAD kinase n=1 Tax=Moheibacter sediminis TaxID=1434700 RepID=A0A1W1YBU8_9FLAO|nr:NAD kinase [Moheibacter sediminis]SMC33291.1 NAD+ kinase [Moheibacter sediminis]
MKKIAVFGLKASEEQKESFDVFFAELQKRKIEFIIDENFVSILKSIISFNFENINTFSNYDDLPTETDLMFTFGGDGTILEAATIIKDKMIPVVGVNTGRLGFLATINIEFLFEKLDDILNGHYNISRRSLIAVESDQQKIEDNFALNEITVTRRETTSMITVRTWMNGEFLNSFWADGLIISTPTGSTGYSLSCGGPIVHPQNNTFIITPIAPHNLNVRPFIISDDSFLDLTIESRVDEYFLSLDSRNLPLSTHVKLRIRKADFEILIVEPTDKSYLNTLREKMFWGSDKRN